MASGGDGYGSAAMSLEPSDWNVVSLPSSVVEHSDCTVFRQTNRLATDRLWNLGCI